METSPKQIYEDYNDKHLDKFSAADQLVSLIENSDNAYIRIKSIEILVKIGSKDDKVFNLLENLLLSDSNEIVRNFAAKAIRILFLEKAFTPMKWAYQYESSISCLNTIISTLGEINNLKAKNLLIQEIKKIDNPQFKLSIHNLFKTKDVQGLSSKILAEIINNYIVIKYFEEKFTRINYKVNNGLVAELDLSCTSKNLLKNLPEFIGVLKYLKKLDLKINGIAKIPTSIGFLSHLKYLDLSNNVIKSLPGSIGSLKSLESLYLRYNNLTNIPNSIGSLKLLKTLDLRHNSLTSIPKSLSDLNLLEVLDLHGNQLHELPKCIKKLSSLKKLELGLNNLKILPNWIKNLNSLRKLGLGSNKLLFNFHEWLGYFHSLKELDLYDNYIKELPESIGLLTSLEVLILRNNQLSELPETFKNMISLRKLNLSWNNFTELPEWFGFSLPMLEELNLWGNKLKTLPESIGSLKSLKVLKVNKYITEIPESIKNLQNNGLIINR